ETDLPRDLGAALLPVQPAGDHQMEHREQLALEAEDDALAETPEAHDPAPGEAGEGRLDGAQQEGTAEPDRLQRLPLEARPQRLQVDLEIGKLRHRRDACAGALVPSSGRDPVDDAGRVFIQYVPEKPT